MEMTYMEAMKWCKDRALVYLDKGDCLDALASFGSDISKNDATATDANIFLVAGIGMPLAIADDVPGLRRFIEGFASA